ncbi:MAG: translational GTPase TypA [Candidatus Caenarcaniphilales bacterium]|nr:translational GTPase TypA [Candidatus Caenarcaniphilales bacterium]
MPPKTENIRNIAIIAHVDHGKTTLLDAILEQTNCFAEHKEHEVCVMDSNPLEKERGITILSKNTSVKYKDQTINIVDTPGHSDFGGEVERVLGMVQGCLLLVDAFEGPMPQTRFVLKKAFEQGLKPILVINKVDKPNSDPARVIDEVLELFIDLGADDDQIEFPIVYASGVNGMAKAELEDEDAGMEVILDTILKEVPPPEGNVEEPFLFQTVSLDSNEYLGRLLVGRILNGTISVNQQMNLIKTDEDGEKSISKKKIAKIYGFHGLEKIELETASAGMIVMIAGMPEGNIGDTVCDPTLTEALPSIKVDEPTLEMIFSVNSSPFAGLEGKFVTSRQIKDRLDKELETNVALKVTPTENTDSFLVAGRGELHLGILIETMRREGYEFQVGKPRVIQKNVDGKIHEPFEELIIDVEDEFSGACIERLGKRKAEMTFMNTLHGRTLLKFLVPTRGLIGFSTEFIRITKGTGIMTHSYYEYKPYAGDIDKVRMGVLVNLEEGAATSYALENFSDRGVFFVKPTDKVYKGMIVGEANKVQDIELNLTKEKALTNMRSAGADVLVQLKAPRQVKLEEALVYINDEELVEITPENIRLRKKILDKKAHRKNAMMG